MTLDDLKQLAALTLREPASALAVMQRVNPAISTRWMALFLAVALSTLLATVARALFPVEVDNPLAAVFAQPITLAIIQLFAMGFAAVLMASVGRIFGGKGEFPDALMVTAWIEMLLVAVQVVQVVVMLIFPAVATMLSLLAFGLFLYLIVQFTKALHGFSSTPLVVLGMIGTLLVVGFALSAIAVSFGILPEVPANDI